MVDIFDEVGEDLRRDRLKRLWQSYGIYVIALAVLIVLGTAGTRAWQSWTDARAAAAGDAFLAALEASPDDAKATADGLVAFASDAPGAYKLLAQFRAAGERAAAGDVETALAVYAQIAADTTVIRPIRDLAVIRSGYLSLDREDLAAIKARVSALDRDGLPWRHAAREIMAVSAVKAANWDEARPLIDRLMQDAELPDDVRQRGEILVDALTAAAGAAAAGG